MISAPDDLTVLSTARLTLRAARESDLADFYEIFSKEDVMRYWQEDSLYVRHLCRSDDVPQELCSTHRHLSDKKVPQ